jgi:hypothetical protein
MRMAISIRSRKERLSEMGRSESNERAWASVTNGSVKLKKFAIEVASEDRLKLLRKF